MKRSFAVALSLSLTLMSVATQWPAGKAASLQDVKTNASAYVCPMHPEVASSSPGTCSKCGMTLTARATDTSGPLREVEAGEVNLRIPDTTVYDQDGKKLRFYTDLVKGKTVIIDFVFTTCTTICPSLTATMRRVQQDLGKGAGRDVRLISVSVDPLTDVPQRLKSFAQRFNAAEGWVFVTGGKPEMDLLLKSLGAYSVNKNDHTPMILIGNDTAGFWTRTYGLAPADSIVRIAIDAELKSAATR